MLYVAIILIVIFLAYFFRPHGEKNQSTKTRIAPELPTTAVHHWDEDDYCDVVGESHYQHSLTKIAEEHGMSGLLAHLIPEKSNPHDKKAVRVDIMGFQVGHLSREDAEVFRMKLKNRGFTNKVTTCNAELKGGHTVDGKKLSFGVVLGLEITDE